jgi:polyisoprenoid-binding protein YceI
MNKRIKVILILLTLSVTLSFMSDTYSRYVVDANSNIEISFAKWQILVNENDITTGTTSNLELTPVIEASNNVKENTIAPSSKGYIDILVNPSNVEMSFNYTVNIKLLNENMPDILISKYAILDESYTEGTTPKKLDIENNEIKGSLTYDNKTKDFTFKPFTIRVYFEWFEGENEQMDNEADTQIAINALNNNTKLQIAASIKFEQSLETQQEPEKEEEIETTE